MQYVWDQQKRLTNIKKHDIDFVDVIGVLEDENALTNTTTEDGEYRYITLSVGVKPGVLLVAHAEDNENGIAIISASCADKSERRQYYEGLIDEWKF